MSLFSRALNDLGKFLLKHFDGDPTAPIVAAKRSAAGLAESLLEMPLYRDVSHYAGFEVPFYKRAQLTSADLAAVFSAYPLRSAAGPAPSREIILWRICASAPATGAGEGPLLSPLDVAAGPSPTPVAGLGGRRTRHNARYLWTFRPALELNGAA